MLSTVALMSNGIPPQQLTEVLSSNRQFKIFCITSLRKSNCSQFALHHKSKLLAARTLAVISISYSLVLVGPEASFLDQILWIHLSVSLCCLFSSCPSVDHEWKMLHFVQDISLHNAKRMCKRPQIKETFSNLVKAMISLDAEMQTSPVTLQTQAMDSEARFEQIQALEAGLPHFT